MKLPRNHLLIAAVVAILAYIPIHLFLEIHHRFDVVNAAGASMGFGIVVFYFLTIWREAGREPLWDAAHGFVVGIWIAWNGSADRILLNWYGRVTGRYLEVSYWAITPFLTWLIAVGGMMHLISRGTRNGVVPPRNWRWLGIILTLAMGVATWLILYVEPLDPPTFREGPAPLPRP